MSSADQFLTLFNKIEQRLDELNQSTRHYGFRRLVENLSKKNTLVAHFKLPLIEYNELRNALVHESTGEAIAEPHPDVITKMEQIYQLLTNPPLAKEIASSPIYTTTTQTPILEVIKAMNRHFYTSIPIYHDQTFVGVFSDHSITQWLAATKDLIDLQGTILSQLQDFFNQADDKFNSYQFLPENVDVLTVKKAFTAFTEEKRRLGAVFLTKNGRKNEKILGIVTAWDLPKIREVRESELS